MKKLTFTPEPEVADRLEKLCEIANLDLNTLLNTLLSPTLDQIIGGGDTDLLQMCIDPFTYNDKEDAFMVVCGYESFVAELKAAGDRCHHDTAKAVRLRSGKWRVAFESTRPADFPFGNIDKDPADWWKKG